MAHIQFDKRFIINGAGVAAVGIVVVCILKTQGFKNSIIDFFNKCKTSIFKCRNLHNQSHSHRSNSGDGVRMSSSPQRRSFTGEELMMYDGVRNERILVSLRRKVYEVEKSLYGPGETYHILAGKEASRCVAKSILDEKQTNKNWSDCTEEELHALDEHVMLYEKKYPLVGWFIPNDNFYEI
ncbi:unnamed protein product [Phytomonas sp. Hart1]|nr:unnamed protein product [Phytomonas sp. Hart1]|eukprot:CCW66488.1 unnamed protein product [Phytomonas sp. isolate Hart1]